MCNNIHSNHDLTDRYADKGKLMAEVEVVVVVEEEEVVVVVEVADSHPDKKPKFLPTPTRMLRFRKRGPMEAEVVEVEVEVADNLPDKLPRFH